MIGFMGTGKSTVGRKIAESCSFEFVDTDALVVELAGKPITEIFKERGESAFRDLETQALEKAADGQHRVISTGGGIILRDENRALLQGHGYCVWLRAKPETVYERTCANNDRPLLQGESPRETIERLLSERDSLYRETAHFNVRTDDLVVEDISYGICESASVFFQDQAD
ncbi:MAG: shikimate kinase [Verrucomicrobiota bacterium]